MAVGIASLALGAIQLGKGIYDASQAQDPTQVEETAEMKAARAIARQMAKRGFTAEEEAAFRQASAATGNTQFRRGVDMGGGNLAAALRASINVNQLNANNQHAAQGAQLMRQNIGMSNSLEQGYQGLKNQQVAQQNALAAQQTQAASQSINSGMSNLGSALNLQQALNYNANQTNPNTSIPINYGANNNPDAFGYNALTGQYNLGNPNQPTYMYPYQGTQNPPTPTYIYR